MANDLLLKMALRRVQGRLVDYGQSVDTPNTGLYLGKLMGSGNIYFEKLNEKRLEWLAHDVVGDVVSLFEEAGEWQTKD